LAAKVADDEKRSSAPQFRFGEREAESRGSLRDYFDVQPENLLVEVHGGVRGKYVDRYRRGQMWYFRTVCGFEVGKRCASGARRNCESSGISQTRVTLPVAR
jgi:hypothetical protein